MVLLHFKTKNDGMVGNGAKLAFLEGLFRGRGLIVKHMQMAVLLFSESVGSLANGARPGSARGTYPGGRAFRFLRCLS